MNCSIYMYRIARRTPLHFFSWFATTSANVHLVAHFLNYYLFLLLNVKCVCRSFIWLPRAIPHELVYQTHSFEHIIFWLVKFRSVRSYRTVCWEVWIRKKWIWIIWWMLSISALNVVIIWILWWLVLISLIQLFIICNIFNNVYAL